MKSESQHVDDDRLAELVATTWLSKREGELYILTNEEEFTIKEAAEELGLETGTGYDYWANAKDKFRKSQATVELNIARG